MGEFNRSAANGGSDDWLVPKMAWVAFFFCSFILLLFKAYDAWKRELH